MSSEETLAWVGARAPAVRPPTHTGVGGGGRWSPAFGKCFKYEFLEHDPHSDCHSSVCLMLPKRESRKCKRNRRRGGKDLYLQIDQADAGVAFVWGALGSQTAPRLPGRETAALAAAKLTCALWCVTIDFLPTTLRLDTAIPVTYVSALLFTQPCSPFWAVICCTTISRFLIDLFKMLDATGCAQLSHIKFPEPRVQLGSW